MMKPQHTAPCIFCDVLSLHNSRFGDFVDRIYPIELKIKDTTDTYRSASYLDLHLVIDRKRCFQFPHYVLLRFTDSDYSFSIFKLLILDYNAQ